MSLQTGGFSQFIQPQDTWSRPGNPNIVVNVAQATNANQQDIIHANVREGYSKENLIKLVTHMAFVKMAPINVAVLPIVYVTAENMTTRWTELVFDAERAAIVGARGRVPNVGYRSIEKKLTSFTIGLGWNAQMIAAYQSITLPNGEKPSLFQLFNLHVKMQIEATLQMYTFEALLDCDKRVNKGLMQSYAQKTLENMFKNRFAAFGLFEKAKDAGLSVLTQLATIINAESKINGGIPPNTLIVRDDLAMEIAAENPLLIRHHNSGDFGIETLKQTKERLNDTYFSIVLNNSPDGMIIPIKDFEAQLKVFGGSIMEEDSIFGEWYLLDGRAGDWGEKKWNKSFEEIQIWDAHNRKPFRPNLMRAVRDCGVWQKDGTAKNVKASTLAKRIIHPTEKGIDMFQDSDGDMYTLFGEWPSKTHFSIDNLAKWSQEVIKVMTNKYPEVVNEFQKLIANGNGSFQSVDQAYKSLLGVVSTSFADAITLFKDPTEMFNVLQTGQVFLARRNSGRATASEEVAIVLSSFTNLVNSVTTVRPGEMPTVLARIIQNDSSFADVLFQLVAYARFGDVPKITFANLSVPNLQAAVAQAAAANKNAQPQIEKITDAYDLLRDRLVKEIPFNNDLTDTTQDVTNALRTADVNVATGAFITVTYKQLVDKSNDWKSTDWTPCRINDPDVLMTEDELKKFVRDHGDVFVHTPGEFIQGGLPGISHTALLHHFSQMNENEVYRNTFLSKMNKIEHEGVKEFLTSDELIGSSVGAKWKRTLPLLAKGTDVVAKILAQTGTVFLDNWNQITSNLYGLELFIAKLFMLTPITLPALERWHRNGFPLPFTGIAIRDWVIVTADLAIACARGAENLGTLEVCNALYTENMDGLTQTQGGTYTLTCGAKITGEKNVVVLRDIRLREFVRGYGADTLFAQERLSGNVRPTASLTFHLVPVGSQLPNVWSTVGTFPNDNLLTPYNLIDEPAIPCAVRLFETMQMEKVIEHAKIDGVILNTVVARGKVTFTEDGQKLDLSLRGTGGMGMLDGIPWAYQ